MPRSWPRAGVVGSLAAAILIVASVSTAQTFLEAPRFPVGTNPRSILAGDVNGDGRKDLVVANLTSQTLSLLLGDGAGGFAPASTYATGDEPLSIAVADFNGDGRTDVVVVNPSYSLKRLLIFLGTPAGLAPPASYYWTYQPIALGTGDFNSDGMPDIVVAGGRYVSILLGNGTGGFALAGTHDLGPWHGVGSLGVGDFNGDGKLDVVAGGGSSPSYTSLDFLPGDGAGGLGTQIPSPGGPSSIAVGDVNNDGKRDLVTIGDYFTEYRVRVAVGDGTGRFTGLGTYGPVYTLSVALADVNGDGKIDIVVPTGSDVWLLLGDGAGGFGPDPGTTPGRGFGAGAGPQSAVAADFDDDGKTDIAAANWISNDVSILLSEGLGIFRAAPVYSTPLGFGKVLVRDFDGDGHLDLVGAGSIYASFLRGDGAGGFALPAWPPPSTLPAAAQDLAAGDFNGDAALDLVASATGYSGANYVMVALGNGSGGFAWSSSEPVGTDPHGVVVGDFNGDGKADVAAANSVSNDVSILLGNGAGGFSPRVNYPVGLGPESLAVGDFNGDGKNDLVVANRFGGTVSILRGDGTGGFGTPMNHSVTPPVRLAVGDVNGDSKLDVVTASYNSVSVLLGDGTGGLGAEANYAAPGSAAVAVGDFNLDGKTDIAVTVASGLSILPGDGAGTFGPAVALATGGLGPLAIGDFNEDTKPDLVAGSLWVFLNTTVLLSANNLSIPEGNSGTTDAMLGVSLSEPFDRTVTVSYETADGTATAGSDYLARSGTLTFPPGTTSRTVRVPILGDRVFEADETFTVTLSGAVNATLLEGQGVGTISNDDPAGLSANDVVVAEGKTAPVSAPFTVTLSPTSTGTVTVDYATADGTATAASGDYTPTSGTLTFGPGFATLPVSVVVNPDAVAEGLETFTLDLVSANGAPIAYAQGTARILDPQVGGDFDGDGRPDILWRHAVSGRNVVWFMDGITRTAGVYTNPAQLPDTNWRIVGTNDFSADGKTDLLWRHAVSGKNVAWYMDGITRTAGVYTVPSQLPDANWRIVGTADFSADGKPDILWRHAVSGKNVVWTMDGISRTGGVYTNPDVLSDTHWQIAGAGDFSVDGKPDLLWRHTISGKNALWFMDGISRTSGVFTDPDTLPDTRWQMVGVGDFSGDAKPDALWRHAASGKIVVWFMDGLYRTGGVFTNPDQLPDTNWKIVGPK